MLLRELFKSKVPRFHATGDVKVDRDGLHVLVMSNHLDDNYYDDYHGIYVVLRKDGSSDGLVRDKSAEGEWEKCKDEIVSAARSFISQDLKLRDYL